MSCSERNEDSSKNTPRRLPVRKYPAHPVPMERHNTAVVLFVTVATQPRGNFLCEAIFHEAFLSACRDADAWSVGRYVIMPDHVHLFCAPAQWPAVEIKRWSGYLKERITKRLKKILEGETVASYKSIRHSSSAVTLPWRWQSDVWDVQMRSGEHYHEKWEYVRQNPIRASLAQEPDAWPWQGEVNVLHW